MNSRTQLIVPAAGLGSRLGRATPKALVPLAGVPLIAHTLGVFHELRLLDSAIVLHPPGCAQEFRSILGAVFPAYTIELVEGGQERQDSVRNALARVNLETEMVVLHDAARPFIDGAIIRNAIDAAQSHGGATVAIPSVDTILESDSNQMLSVTPDRSRLWSCQTPQVFRVQAFQEAHTRASAEHRSFTDDATLFRHYGGEVKIVMGSSENRKITTEDDLRYAEFVLSSRQSAHV